MVCLDTSVLVALLRKDRAAIDGLTAEAERGGKVSTTTVNLCELYSGAYGSKNPQKELARVQDLVSNLGLFQLDASAAKRYGELVNDAALKRAPIGDLPDNRIDRPGAGRETGDPKCQAFQPGPRTAHRAMVAIDDRGGRVYAGGFGDQFSRCRALRESSPCSSRGEHIHSRSCP